MGRGNAMTIEEACAAIMGKEMADAIIDDMGISWCVVAAVCDPGAEDQPEAAAIISAWLYQQQALT